jgi:hypothetical protein
MGVKFFGELRAATSKSRASGKGVYCGAPALMGASQIRVDKLSTALWENWRDFNPRVERRFCNP